MNHPGRSIAAAIAGVIALGSASMTISAQANLDLENKYSNVGAIMVWSVDDAGHAVELRGFASGTLIRDRVMVTAGHFTAPAKAAASTADATTTTIAWTRRAFRTGLARPYGSALASPDLA